MDIDYNYVYFGSGGSTPDDLLISPMFDIVVDEAYRFSLSNNRVITNNADNSDHGFRWGFYIRDWAAPSDFHKLAFNQVVSADADFDLGCCAYHFESSGPWLICQNTSDKTLRGFHLSGACMNSNYIQNEMGEHRSWDNGVFDDGTTAAFLLESNTIISPQACKFNKWLVPDYGVFGDGTVGAWNKCCAANNRFEVPNTNPALIPFPINLVGNIVPFPNAWFGLDPNCEQDTSNNCKLIDGSRDGEVLDSMQRAFIDENLLYEPVTDAATWLSRYDILRLLLRNPIQKDSYPNAETFFQNYVGSSELKFAEWSENYNKALVCSTNFADTLNLYLTAINDLQNELDSLRTGVTIVNGAPVFNIELSSRQPEIWNTIADLHNKINLLRESEQNIINTNLQVLEQDLLQLPEVAPIEANLRYINLVHLMQAQGIDLSSQDTTILESIANQCFEFAGRTKFTAMNLLFSKPGVYRRGDVIDFSLGCQTDQRSAEGAYHYSNNDFKVFPNPAYDQIVIQSETDIAGSLLIVNMFGVVFKSIEMSDNTSKSSIPVGHIPNGIYQIRFIHKNGFETIKSLVIIR